MTSVQSQLRGQELSSQEQLKRPLLASFSLLPQHTITNKFSVLIKKSNKYLLRFSKLKRSKFYFCSFYNNVNFSFFNIFLILIEKSLKLYKNSRYDNVLAIIKSAELFHKLYLVRFNFSIRNKQTLEIKEVKFETRSQM